MYGGYKDYQKPLLEMGVLIESAELASLLVNSVSALLPGTAWQLRLNDNDKVEWVQVADDKEVVYTKPPQTSAWRRFSASATNFKVLEGQL